MLNLKDDELELATFYTTEDEYSSDHTLTINSAGQCRICHENSNDLECSYTQKFDEIEPSFAAGWMGEFQFVDTMNFGMYFPSFFLQAYLYRMTDNEIMDYEMERYKCIHSRIMDTGIEVAILREETEKALDYQTLVIGKNDACHLKLLHIDLADKGKKEETKILNVCEAVDWMMENQLKEGFAFGSAFWELYHKRLIEMMQWYKEHEGTEEAIMAYAYRTGKNPGCFTGYSADTKLTEEDTQNLGEQESATSYPFIPDTELPF